MVDPKVNNTSPTAEEKPSDCQPSFFSSSATFSLNLGTEETTAEPDEKPSRLDPDIESRISVIEPLQDVVEKVPQTIDMSATDTASQDPSIIDWESPETPDKAVNWTSKKKWSNMAIISTITFLTPLASTMIAPGVPLILRDFSSADETVGSLIVSIYILGYAIGPLLLAPLSEVYGRLPVYHMCNSLFIVWTIACALAPNTSALLIFRVLAGIAGSCPLAIGGGSIADLFIQQQRGVAMSVFIAGPLLGPVVGPIAGGFLTEDTGWRWVFWVITIAAGVIQLFSVVFMCETYEPVLLERRVNQVKKKTGRQDLRSKLDPCVSTRDVFIRAIIRPSKMLILSPIVLVTSIYMALVLGYLYLLFTTLTQVFQATYGFSQGTVGLTYLGLGIGSLIGLLLFATFSDRLIAKLSKSGEMKPEYRLFPLILGSLFIPIGLFWYGWSAQKKMFWIMPIIGTGWIGFGMLATLIPIQIYLIDGFTRQAASALAANMVLRSLVGAFLPLAGPKMYAALGLGCGNSLLAFIALAMAPITWIFYRYGEQIRMNPRFRANF